MRSPPYGKIARLNGSIGLQADDDLVVAVDIAGLVRQQRRGRLRIDGQHALLLLLLEIGLQLVPDRLGARGRRRQELFVAVIGRRRCGR